MSVEFEDNRRQKTESMIKGTEGFQLEYGVRGGP